MTYEMKLPPRQCQSEALTKMEGKTAFALHMAMRTGKSKVIIDDFGKLELDDKVDDLLIIATGGSYRTWEVQLKDHCPAQLLSRLKVFVWDSRKMKTKTKALELLNFERDAHTDQPRCLLINIEALSGIKWAQQVVDRFAHARRCMVAIDESTSIRNHKSKRTKFVLDHLANAERRRTLTGLPNPKSPLDLYSQFLFLNKNIIGYDTFVAFEERYAEFKRICIIPKRVLQARLKKALNKDHIMREGFGRIDIADMKQQELLAELTKAKVYVQQIKQINGFKNQEELRDKIAPHVYRKTLEDCYDLPPKTYIRREVELTDEQRRVYEEMQAFYTTQLQTQEHVTAANVITCMLKLHQILCGHVKDESGTIKDVPTKRPDSLLELLDEYDGKAIIWCSYDYDVQRISQALGPESARVFGAAIRIQERKRRKDFLTEDACRFIVATPAAGGKGRTWINADLVVYYSNSHDLEHRLQSEERAQGVGKTSSVAYVDMVAPDTVDEKILLSLRHKINLASVINGDNWKEWIV